MYYYPNNGYFVQPTVLILDSGVGGLFIYNVVKKISPYFCYLYLFDNEFFPYGKRSEIFIIKRMISIIETIHKKSILDLVIIACNTASLVSLQILKMYFSFPIIGVIPEIKLASKYTRNGVIGILATYRTIHHSYIINLVQSLLYKYQYKVLLMESSKLVKLAESKICGDKILKSEFQNILDPWLKLETIPDTIVLGCTHFSLLKKELKSVLPINTYLIDSGYDVGNYIRNMSKKYSRTKIIYNDYACFKKNIAFCTTLNAPNIEKLRSVLLLQYDFFCVETLLV